MKHVMSTAVAVMLGAVLFGCASPGPTPSPSPSPTPPPSGAPKRYSAPPPMTINVNKEYAATIETNYGTVTVRLFPKEAPVTVNNFVFLAREGFYNGVKVHRIVKGFMFQTGDPRGDGTGGPGYQFNDEKVTRDYKAGILAMANAGPNTNGSQFFIMLADYPLPKQYNIFGEVTGGFDKVQAIGSLPVTRQTTGTEVSKPTVDVYIKSITIQEK